MSPLETKILGLLMKDGRVVYQHGFGWKDEDRDIRMPENALVRIASCTKPVTAAAIRHLIAEHPTYTLDDRVFDLSAYGQYPPGALEIGKENGST